MLARPIPRPTIPPVPVSLADENMVGANGLAESGPPPEKPGPAPPPGGRVRLASETLRGWLTALAAKPSRSAGRLARPTEPARPSETAPAGGASGLGGERAAAGEVLAKNELVREPVEETELDRLGGAPLGGASNDELEAAIGVENELEEKDEAKRCWFGCGVGKVESKGGECDEEDPAAPSPWADVGDADQWSKGVEADDDEAASVKTREGVGRAIRAVVCQAWGDLGSMRSEGGSEGEMGEVGESEPELVDAAADEGRSSWEWVLEVAEHGAGGLDRAIQSELLSSCRVEGGGMREGRRAERGRVYQHQRLGGESEVMVVEGGVSDQRVRDRAASLRHGRRLVRCRRLPLREDGGGWISRGRRPLCGWLDVCPLFGPFCSRGSRASQSPTRWTRAGVRPRRRVASLLQLAASARPRQPIVRGGPPVAGLASNRHHLGTTTAHPVRSHSQVRNFFSLAGLSLAACG